MAERDYPSNTKEADTERSSKDIRQDLAKEKENISQTVEQIGERIKEELDWRGYVKDSPYWSIGIAAGLGFLASRMFMKRTTPIERIMDSIADEVRNSLDGLHAGGVGSGLIKATLLGIATQAAASWIKKSTSTSAASSDAGPRPLTGGGSTNVPES